MNGGTDTTERITDPSILGRKNEEGGRKKKEKKKRKKEKNTIDKWNKYCPLQMNKSNVSK